jgi:hypothetical protein
VANVNVQLTGAALQVIDNAASTIRVNSPISTIVGQTAASVYDAYFQLSTVATVISPFLVTAGPAWQIYIRNISGSNTVSLLLTPTGGSAWASPLILVPNAVFIYMATYSTNPASGGVSLISMTASANNTFIEFFYAG